MILRLAHASIYFSPSRKEKAPTEGGTYIFDRYRFLKDQMSYS